MTRVLITGATGFIGGSVVRALASHPAYEVHALGREHRATGAGAGVHYHAVDLSCDADRRAVLAAVRPTAMIHLAWNVPPGAFWTALDNISWLEISLDLLRDFADAGGRRWIGAGTCAEYDWSIGGRLDEDHPCRPATLYGACKHSLGLIATRMGSQVGVEVAWGRIFNPYGPGEPEGRLVSSTVTALLSGREAKCTEGLQKRDFMYVEDVGNALVAVLRSQFTGVVNIGSGSAVAVRDVVVRIAKATGREDLLRVGSIAAREFEVPEIYAGLSVLRSIGFEPAYTIEEGIARTVDWWRGKGGRCGSNDK